MRLFAASFLLSLIGLVGAAQAQTADGSQHSSILTIDQDRLFAETQLGARSAAAVEEEARQLADENRRIEEELVAEELTLTEKRSGLTPEEFTQLADEFDAKVQRLRTEQDAKARAVAAKQDQARQQFFVEIGGVLSEIISERGADVVVDRRDVFISADRVDITDEAIRRINEQMAEPEPDGSDSQ